MNVDDVMALSPLLWLLGGALLLLLVESFFELAAKRVCCWICLATIVGAFYAALIAPGSSSSLLTPWLRFDDVSRFFTFFFLFIGFCSTLLAMSFFQRFKATHGEYYFLLLASLFGLLLIAASADFLTLFLGLETLSISLYILCGYMKRWKMSHESAIKYFLMGSVAAAFTLYGIALIYGALGTTRFDLLLKGFQELTVPSEKLLFYSGIALVTLGLAFKAAIVPFHTWAPDVYDGAPNPVTAFMAVGTKAGAFAAFIVVFMIALPDFDPAWQKGISWLAFPTLIYANIVALRQTQLRRFFAYSGISHAGFLLIPLAVGGPEALSALLFYLVIYAIATLGAFAVLACLDQRSEGVVLYDLNGLFKRSPLLATLFSLCLLTLAGIPPTAGFFAKFYLFKIAFAAGYYALVIVGLLTTILSAYYYLRIVLVLFAEPPEEQERKLPSSWSAMALSITLFLLLVLLSINPQIAASKSKLKVNSVVSKI